MLESLIKIDNKLQYCSKFPDGTVIYFSILSLDQYKSLETFKKVFELDDNLFYEEIYNLCVPSHLRDLGGRIRAGIPQSIGQFIWYQSNNYDLIEQEIEMARVKYNDKDIYEQMKILIMSAFTSYKLSELDSIARTDLIGLFVRAETFLVSKTEGKYKPINTKRLRKKEAAIDFEKENKHIQREFGNNPNGLDDPWSRNSKGIQQANAVEVMKIRERAARKADARNKRIKESD